jgi:hypothetical protein
LCSAVLYLYGFLTVLDKTTLLQYCQNWPHLLTRQWAIESGKWVDFHNNYWYQNITTVLCFMPRKTKFCLLSKSSKCKKSDARHGKACPVLPLWFFNCTSQNGNLTVLLKWTQFAKLSMGHWVWKLGWFPQQILISKHYYCLMFDAEKNTNLFVVKKKCKKVMQGMEKLVLYYLYGFLIVLDKTAILQCCWNRPTLLTRQWAVEYGNWVNFHNNYWYQNITTVLCFIARKTYICLLWKKQQM